MEDPKNGIEHIKQAKAHMHQATWIINDCISRLKALEEENVALKAELALIHSESSYMELPLDADGIPVRIGDTMDVDGDPMTVVGYRSYDETLFLIVKESGSNCTYSPKPSSVRHFKCDPSDSWEKLEEDARKTPCDYACAPLDSDGLTTCDGCRLVKKESCHAEMTLEVLERAKKLAGVEEAKEASDD